MSGLLHLIVLVFVWLMPAARPLPAPPDRAIAIDIVLAPAPAAPSAAMPAAPPDRAVVEPRGADRPAPGIAVPNEGRPAQAGASPAATAPPPDRQAAALRAAPRTPPAAPSVPNPTVRAKILHSSQILADPRSRKALVALRQLVPEDRIIQLCNVEAMEQVHVFKPDLHPDLLIAYAMDETRLAGFTLTAEGGALRNQRQWYRIGFTCEVSPDLETVLGFEFTLGDLIPQAEWQAHLLTASDPAD